MNDFVIGGTYVVGVSLHSPQFLIAPSLGLHRGRVHAARSYAELSFVTPDD
jgi:hypothetical protein